MFSKELQGLSLVSEVANEFFPNIIGSIRGYDQSLLATVRALIAPRMKDSDTIHIKVKSVTTSLSSYSDDDAVLKLTDGLGRNTLLFCGINGSETTSNYNYEVVEKSFLRHAQGFTEFEALNAFMKSKHLSAHCYINVENRSTVVYVKGFGVRIYHLMQAFLTKFLPWFFTEEHPITEEEKALLRALTLSTSAEYETLIEKFAQKYDFRSVRIKQVLKGFETSAKEQMLRNENNRFQSIENDIQNNIRSYRNLIEQRSDALIRIAGLQHQITEIGENSELMEFFLHNKHLNPLSTNGSVMDFIVCSTLNNFDPEMYDTMRTNRNGYFYNSYEVTSDTFRTVEARRELMDEIFGEEPTLKIKMCGYYSIDIRGTVTSYSGYSFPREYAHYIPNPHLHHYNCLGDHKRFIEENLRNGDVVGAIAQCVSSTGSINLGEGITVEKFLRTLFSHSCQDVIELPNGTSCNPAQALAWVRANKNKEEN